VFSFMLKPWNPDHLQAELGKALSLYRMRERERVQQKHLREELEWAGELQRTLFSVALPATDRLDLSASYRPLPEFGCGGDFYDVIRLGPEQHLILIGDVAGHGVRAALVSAVMRSLVSSGLTARASSSATPAGILGWLNRRLCLYLHAAAGLLVSCAACSIDAAAGRLVYSNAGHPPGLLLHGGRPSSLKLDGPPLGAAQDTEYHERAWTLEPGDHLVMYTDGLIDIDKGATSAGMLRLEQVLQTLKDGALTADSLVDGVLAAAGTTASDDIAALIVRLKPA